MTHKTFRCPLCSEIIAVWGNPTDTVETEFVIQKADHINRHAKEIIEKHREKVMIRNYFEGLIR